MVLLLLLLIPTVEALEVKNLSIEYERYSQVPRLLELPNSKARDKLALNLDINLFKNLYFDNRVHLIGTNSQVEWVGWAFEIGLSFNVIDIYRYHHSQHTLDTNHPTSRFPVEDTYGIRLNIVGERRQK